MKNKILAALKAKFVGVSEPILNRIATKMAKTVTTDEEVTSSVEGVTLQFVMDSNADFRANEASESAVSTYEKKHGLKDGLKADGGKPKNKEPKDGDDGSNQFEAFEKRLKDLETENTTLKNEKVTIERGASIRAKQAELKIPDWRMVGVVVPDGADMTTFLTGIKQDLINNNLMPEDAGEMTSSSENAQKEAAVSFLDEIEVKDKS